MWCGGNIDDMDISTQKASYVWVVELEEGCWLAEANGDPPRTLVFANARRFVTHAEAVWALKRARHWRRFNAARIVPTVDR